MTSFNYLLPSISLKLTISWVCLITGTWAIECSITQPISFPQIVPFRNWCYLSQFEFVDIFKMKIHITENKIVNPEQRLLAFSGSQTPFNIWWNYRAPALKSTYIHTFPKKSIYEPQVKNLWKRGLTSYCQHTVPTFEDLPYIKSSPAHPKKKKELEWRH